MVDMPIMWYLTVPLVVFLAFVLPLWIVFHYVTKWKRMKQGEPAKGYAAVDPRELKQLRDTARKLAERLDSLEKILDRESPGWRNR